VNLLGLETSQALARDVLAKALGRLDGLPHDLGQLREMALQLVERRR